MKMKRSYIQPVCNCMASSYEDGLLQVVSNDLNKQGTSVRVDDDDTSGNAWNDGRSNSSPWDDPDAEV